MNDLELKHYIERQGYEFLSIHHLKKGFRVRYQDQDARYSRTFHETRLDEIRPDSSKLWHHFTQDFPPVKVKT